MMLHDCACLTWGVGALSEPNIERTYNQVSISGAVHFICNVDWPASALGNRDLAFLRGFEVPDRMVVLGVLLQLFRC
jgi:hypothetical protein